MRVISGIAKSRRIRSPKGLELRPTSDKVKESLFNIIRERVEGSRFLDLFSGTGNVGIEALSRGASEVTFVEKNPRFLRIIRENLSLLGLELKGEITLSGAGEYIRRAAREGKRYDIIFIDPPYKSDILEREIWPLLGDTKILAQGGIIIVEHFFKKRLESISGKMMLKDEYRYGETLLSLFISAKDGEE